METILRGALLAFDDGLVPGELRFSGDKITAITPLSGLDLPGSSLPGGSRPAASADAVVVECGGRVLAPGFIDLHCHGGAGADVNDATDASLAAVGAFHRSRGVTSYTPSLSVDPLPTLLEAFASIRRAMAAPRPGDIEILGAHFESPYINPRFKGCQAAERLLPFDAAARKLIAEHADVIARVTLAPELPGVLDAIPALREKDIVVSVGHSEADAATFRAAVDRGATMVTHLYNAMSSVRKEGPFRVPGVLEAALSDDRVYAEVIADGRHVPPEMLEIARRCKGPDRFLVCSDANRGAGMAPGASLYTCGQEAIVENGVAMLKDRSSLASSVTALDGMVRTLVRELCLPVHLALRAASAVPAAAIGVAHRKGRLAVGYDADLVLLDEDLEVRAVWCRGVGGDC